jgi:hypothetical protein
MSENQIEKNPNRELIHHREFDVKVFKRDDGLWDVEAQLIDTKGKDFNLVVVQLKKGEPVHFMKILLTINPKMEILFAEAEMLARPYPGYCEQIVPDYSKLVGLNLSKGFRNAVREKMGGINGCTHINELSSIIPTAVYQAFVNEVFPVTVPYDPNRIPKQKLPFQFNGCHSWNVNGEVVKKYHPTWYGFKEDAKT